MIDLDLKISSVEEKKKIVPPHIVEMGLSMVYVEPMEISFSDDGSYVLEITEFKEDSLESLSVDRNVSCVIIPSDELSGGDVEHISIFKQFHSKPVLAKDLFVDEYQVLLSRVYMADGVVIKPGIVDDALFERLFHLTRALGMFPMIEIETQDDFERFCKLSEEVCVLKSNGNGSEVVYCRDGSCTRKFPVVRRGM